MVKKGRIGWRWVGLEKREYRVKGKAQVGKKGRAEDGIIEKGSR